MYQASVNMLATANNLRRSKLKAKARTINPMVRTAFRGMRYFGCIDPSQRGSSFASPIVYATRDAVRRSPTSSLSDAVQAAARITNPPQVPTACVAALKRGTSSLPIDSGPSTPRVVAATARKTTAATPIPPMIAIGIVRRGFLISPAMIAVRMKPSQVQKNIAAPASTPNGPLSPNGFEKWLVFTAGVENATKSPNRDTFSAMRVINTLVVS